MSWQYFMAGAVTALVLVMVWKAMWTLLLSESAVKWAESEALRARARAEAVRAAYGAWSAAIARKQRGGV